MDIHLALSGNTGHRHQHRFWLQQDCRYRHGPCQQYGPRLAGQATYINMALRQQHGFRLQHRSWTSAWSSVVAQAMDINPVMAAPGPLTHRWSEVAGRITVVLQGDSVQNLSSSKASDIAQGQNALEGRQCVWGLNLHLHHSRLLHATLPTPQDNDTQPSLTSALPSNLQFCLSPQCTHRSSLPSFPPFHHTFFLHSVALIGLASFHHPQALAPAPVLAQSGLGQSGQ